MSHDTLPSVLTLEQAAGYLQLTAAELDAELEGGKIPAWKVAGKWRIKRDVLTRLLERAPSDPAPHPQSQAPESSLSQRLPTDPAATDRLQPMAATVAVDHQSPSSPLPLASSRSSLEEPPSPSRASAPALGPSTNDRRLHGRVYAYNSKERFGHARTADNRVVWVDFEHLVDQNAQPSLGDTIEFDLHRSPRRGLEALAITIVAKDEKPAAPSPVARAAVARAPRVSPPSIGHRQEKPGFSLPARSSRPAIPPEGTPQSQGSYQNAAVARAEGRIDDARRLFRQSIEAGGGTHVYEAFFKMELERGTRADAPRRIIQQALATFPEHVNFYEMYGQMERRLKFYDRAEKIFRNGLLHAPRHVSLRWGLGQTLVQIGTEKTLKEAGQIFEALDREGKLHKRDRLYQRFHALQRSPRANKAFDFFQRIADIRIGIAGRRDLPTHITDIVAEITNTELGESFGLTGAFIVRCFQRIPRQIEILDLTRYLRSLGPQYVLGLQDREVILNSSLAFIAVPHSNAVRDQVMSVLSESNEAIVPLDDSLFADNEDPLKILRDLLGQYLGSRDLYNSSFPVSGRRFFGRERLLLHLTDEVQRGQFLGIYGLRKTGKTSLIYQFRDEKLRAEAVAYVDLNGSAALTTGNCAPLYWELERDLYIRLREHQRDAAEFLRLGKMERFSDVLASGVAPALLFSEDLRAFLDALGTNRIPGIRRLVIVIDELERLLPVAGQAGIAGYLEFFGLLRGLAQTERYRGLLSSVVVAANAAISERGYWEGRENPVFALYKTVFLPPLSELECTEMIRTLGKGMSVYWNPEAISSVIAETGGHPFLTRALCSRIARQNVARPLRVTADMVQAEIGPFIRDDGDKLDQITELLRTNFPEEETLLQRIAIDEAPAEMSDEALRHLLGYQLIVADPSGYRITLNILRRWLRRRAGIKE